MSKQIQVNVASEIGKLNAVILHTPGKELQNMTPETAQRALYSDILNLTVAREEYTQLKGALEKITKTFEVSELLKDVLKNDKVRFDIINRICTNENVIDIRDYLLDLSYEELGRQLIEGVIMKKDSLTKFLAKDKYSLQPLHNFFFTRDSSIAVRDRILIGRMASRVRKRESLIMETIFNNHSDFVTQTINPDDCNGCVPELSVEGGDVLIARKDIMLIGSSSRTTTQGIDFIINRLKDRKLKRDLIIQELPPSPESFIHLDMVFTLLDKDTCMIYEPLIMKPNKYQTIHVKIDDGQVQSIDTVESIPAVLKTLGMDLKPVICGGTKDVWTQEREQWHSGANFFAVAPGKVLGYGRNYNTIEELNKAGFDVIPSQDIISGKTNLDDHKKAVICIEGSELARGGGGARCMTMPVSRDEVDW